MASPLKDEALKEIALKWWRASDGEPAFNKAFPDMLPKLKKAADEDSDMLQHVAASSRPGAGVVDWWNYPSSPSSFMASHISKVEQVAIALCNEHSPQAIERTKKRQADAEEKERDAEAKKAAERQQLQEEFKQRARVKFVAAGGDPKNFEKEFPEIWATHLRAKAAQPDDSAAVRETAAYLHSQF